MNHYPYFMNETRKNSDKIIEKMFPTNDSEKKSLNNFVLRVLSIVEPHANVNIDVT